MTTKAEELAAALVALSVDIEDARQALIEQGQDAEAAPTSQLGPLIRAIVGGGPSAPEADIRAGFENGEVDINVTELPDFTTGTGSLWWWNETDGWQMLADPAAIDFYTVHVSPPLYGSTTTIKVRGVSPEGLSGIVALATVTISGDEHILNDLTIDTDAVLYDATPMTVWVPA